MYQPRRIFSQNNRLYLEILPFNEKDTEILELDTPLGEKMTQKECILYSSPGPLHIIDEHGIGVCQQLQWRPFALPPGSRRPLQWEFDKWCYENPDPNQTLDINAIVYKSWCKNKEIPV